MTVCSSLALTSVPRPSDVGGGGGQFINVESVRFVVTLRA